MDPFFKRRARPLLKFFNFFKIRMEIFSSFSMPKDSIFISSMALWVVASAHPHSQAVRTVLPHVTTQQKEPFLPWKRNKKTIHNYVVFETEQRPPRKNQKIVKTTLSTWQNRLLQIGLPKTIDLGRLGLRPGFARRTKSTSLDFFEIKFFFRRRPKKSLRIDFCFFKHGSALSRCPPVAEKKTK